MAKLQSISQLFIAADYVIKFTVYDPTETSIVDVTGMSLSWMLKKRLTHPDSAKLLAKTNGDGLTIDGVYNANPVVNTQRVVVTLKASDTINFKPRVIAHELKRMDVNFETVLSYGPATLERGVHRT